MAADVIQLALRLKDEASKGITAAAGATNALGDEALTTREKMKMMGRAALKVSAAFAGTAVAVGVMVKSLADAQNLLRDTATRTGLTTETLAGLKLAAEGSGLQFESLATGLTQFPKRLSDMARNTGEAKVAFEQLGMSVTNADGSLRSADDVMKEALTRLHGVEDATTKAALANQLFGESGTLMLQALSGTELEDFVDEAARFGLKIGPDAAKAAGDLQREIARFSLVSQRSQQMFLEAFGGEGGASGAVKGFGAALIGTVTAFGAVMDSGRLTFRTIAGAVTDLITLVIGLGSAMVGVFSGDFAGASREASKALAAYRVGLQTTGQEAMELLETGGILGAIKKGVEAGRAAFEAPTAGAGAGRAPAARTQLAAVGEEAKASEAAQKAMQDRQKAFDAAAKAFSSQMERLNTALMGPQTKSQQMQTALDKLTESFNMAQAKAMALGNTSSEEFQAMATDFESTSQRMQVAIKEQQAAEMEARRMAGLGTGAQALQAAGGGASGMLSFAGAAAGPGSVAGPIVGAIQGLGALGQMGAEKFREDLKEFINNVITGLVEVLPEIIGEVPLAVIDALPELITGALQALPKILARQFITLPISIAKGAGLALREIWETMKKWLSNALEKISPKGIVKGIGSGIKSLGKTIGGVLGFQSGGFVRNTGLALVHAGERIIPTSGASTQAVMAGAENIGSGQAVTINTSVVDPNAIDGLARMLQRELGSFGGGRDLSIFNTPAASAG